MEFTSLFGAIRKQGEMATENRITPNRQEARNECIVPMSPGNLEVISQNQRAAPYNPTMTMSLPGDVGTTHVFLAPG